MSPAIEYRGRREINCCAMTTRKAAPPVSTRVCRPQSEENAVTRSKQSAHETAAFARDDIAWADDRRELCEERRIFTFEPCAIAAFARETAERESHGAMTRDCASQRVHTSQRESIGRAHFAETTAIARTAHDSYDAAGAYNPLTRIATRIIHFV